MTEVPRRLRWRCRRGMKELDLLFARYLEARYVAAPEAERRAFEVLLGNEDPDLWSWLIEAEPISRGGLEEVVDVLRRYR